MKKILFLILPFVIFSCSNETDESMQIPELDFEVYNFEYNGEKYSVKYYYAEDSTVIFQDPAMRELLEKIDEEPELATFVNTDGSLSLFSDYNTLVDKMGLNSVGTRSSYVGPFELILYDKDNYGGDKLIISEIPPVVQVNPNLNDLRTYGFDDKTSSAKLTNKSRNRIVVTFYQKVHESGKSLTFKLDPPDLSQYQLASYLSIPKFSKYTLKSGVLGIGKKTWDNKVSAIYIRNDGD